MAQSANAHVTNARDSAPEGIARFAVRGFFASSSASSRRFAAIATVRAVTMQTRIKPSCPHFGHPFVARNVLSSANGIAKIVWLSLMSRAKIARRDDSVSGLDVRTTSICSTGF